ncbi:MAG: archease [Dehalococcoidia bacterium]
MEMTGDKPPFEILDHTADVGVCAHGATLGQAFEHAALAMFSVMADLTTVAEVEERRLEVHGDDRETLLVAWLSELLYLSDTQGMLFRRFAIDELAEGRLRGRAWGERIDRDRHALGTGVKAVTRHMLAVYGDDDGYRVRVIFDI